MFDKSLAKLLNYRLDDNVPVEHTCFLICLFVLAQFILIFDEQTYNWMS